MLNKKGGTKFLMDRGTDRAQVQVLSCAFAAKNSYSIIHTLSITHSFSLLIILKTWSYCCVSKVGYKRFLSACRRLKLLSINSFIMHESKSMNGWPTVPKNIFVKIPYYFLIDLWQEYYSSIFLFSEEKEGTQEEIQK